MWIFNSFYKTILIKKNVKKKIFFFYNNLFTFIIYSFVLKTWKGYIFTNNKLFIKGCFLIGHENKIINLKYKGKVFRIKKKKKAFLLLLNYTGYNYLIWNNIKIKKRRRKKIIFIFILTNSNLKIKFFQNLIKLRRLNTYTKRGVYNNIFIHYARKRRIKTHR